MKIRIGSLLIISLLRYTPLLAATLHIGPGRPYATLGAAAAAAQPGDTLELHAATYSGGLFLYDLTGKPAAWITIRAAAGDSVIFNGGTEALHFINPAYVHIKGLVFQNQKGNGVNTDDGGSYQTPAHHVVFENCIFRNIDATGNNDLLKLSGLDSFIVRNCLFLNGSPGGSGIDMVGCHYGLIEGNRFENQGSNSIQCKGGSAFVRIEANLFKNGGARALNLGGSTGLAFFRPDTAHYEAAYLQVFSNIIIGSEAAIAFVGSVYVEVVNNTIYKPGKWVFRILQETVDPSRFVECGDNSFVNNLVVIDKAVTTQVNIGPNTRPETFLFQNNLWYHTDQPAWTGPVLPAPETSGLKQLNPQLKNPGTEDFRLLAGSPAIAAGKAVLMLERDYYRQLFAPKPSIGAAEGKPVSAVWEKLAAASELVIHPNPTHDFIRISIPELPAGIVGLQLFDVQGRQPRLFNSVNHAGGSFHAELTIVGLPTGWYIILMQAEDKRLVKKVFIQNL